MARGSSWGVGSASSTIRFWSHEVRTEQVSSQSVRALSRLRPSLCFLLAGLFVTATLSGLAFAQNEQNDIHVVPREQQKDNKPDPTVMPPAVAAEAKAAGVSVDPSLKTHTKPIRKDVDLVLVPVTITDPMNRLVTGLEKENFFLTDNGQPQEIRHFSSEDAPLSIGVVFD